MNKNNILEEIEELNRLVVNYTQNVEYGSPVTRAALESRIKLLEKLMKTQVISAFPACGKTYVFENNKNLNILDSDSSEFSWVKDDDGKNTKERNPNFPENYIDHIKKNLGKVDIIFVSSHDVVRRAMETNMIHYTLVHPDKSLKDEWVKRFEDRGNNQGFIDFISKNWDNFIDDIESEVFPLKVRLEQGKYIGDVFK